MAFRYQALDASGQTVTDTVNAESAREAGELLRDRGLFVTQMEETRDVGRGTAAAIAASTAGKAGGRFRDVLFFTQQMSMLLRSGARVVDALYAIEEQTTRASWQRVVRAVRMEVEEGRPLSEALSQFPKLFTGIYASMVSAGEASGDMGLAFDRLIVLTRQQQLIRSRVIGAMAYPAVLSLLCLGVIVALFTFVLPRFAEMFDTLDVEVPASTAVLIAASNGLRAHWPYAVGAIVATVGGLVFFLRSPAGRLLISRASVRVPLFGSLVRRIILARICRTWGQLLESRVGLIDSIELVQDSTNNPDFRGLLDDIKEAVTEGNSVGPALKNTWLIPKTFAAAMVTGEESGKLVGSLLFVASCLEEDNAQALASLARVIEPIMLVVMGLVVGTVAVSLFLPMFDMATLTGGG